MEDPISVRRKKLSEVRQMLANQTEEHPFSISNTLSTGETISDFVVSIAINIHKKRTTKPKQLNT
jgi:hypothetical protein